MLLKSVKMRLLIVLITLCYILKVCVLVEGRYSVEVRLNGYTNPTGKCEDCNSMNLICCDRRRNQGSTNACHDGDRCDSLFIYCLRPFGEVGQGCFPNEERSVSAANTDDGPLDFSQSTVLGLNNPQVLSGLEDIYDKGIQLYIEIIDEDPQNHQPNESVDILLIDHNLTVAESRQQNYTGLYGFVTMNLTITVFCEGKFSGSDCTQCVPSFTGPDCNETDRCFGMDCSGNGECSVDGMGTFHCTCDSGFTGELCQTNIDDCVGMDCNGNEECTPGFSGPLCSSEVEGSSESSVSTGRVGAIAGGVVGALLAVVVLLISIMVIIMIVLKYRHYNSFKSREANNQGSGNSGPMPGDNPVYEPGNTTSNELKGGLSPHTTAAVTTLPGREGIESSEEERKFDNPIYGGDETDDNVYTTPFDQQDQPNHEFDNPVYGSETYDS